MNRADEVRSENVPSPDNAWKWFNPLGRQAGGLAFILNRITALGLTLYLYLHLAVLSTLARGPESYDGFLKLIHNPVMILMELLVVAAGLIHGLNGLRIAKTSLGIGVGSQKLTFYLVLAISLVVTAIFAVRMFGG